MSATLNPNPQSQPNDGAPGEGNAASPASTTRDPDDMQSEFDKEELRQRVIDWFHQSRDHYQEWRQDASEAFDFVAGRQWSDEDAQILADQSRPAVTFNRIAPFVDGVSGLEIGNRQETQYIPRQLGASGVNDLLTAAAKWVRDECLAEDEESEAVRDNIICGSGWMQTRMDYDEDPDGEIRIERVDPLEVYPDPSSRKPNYADGRFVIRVKDVPVKVAEEMFPDHPTSDLHAQWAEDELDAAHSPHNARIAPYYRIDQADQIDQERAQCRLVEVEWWDYVPAFRVEDPQSGRFIRLSPDKAMLFELAARAQGQPVNMIKAREKRYYKALLGNIVLRVLRGPDDGGFTYKAMTGKRDRNKGYWYGIVRAMLDPQRWANKFFTQALHIVNTNAKGGLLAETDAFVDVEEARDSWASADSIVELNPGGLGKVEQRQPPAFPVQINQMMETAVSAIPATAGINLEMIAQQTANQAGVLEMQRKQQGMSVLAYIFDAKRRYQKEQGRLLLWMIITFIADGRLIRIGGPDNAQYVPLVHQPGLSEYDVIVDDAPSSPNMKERVWSMIMQMFPMLRSMPLGPQAMMELMRYSPFPASLVEKVGQAMQQPQPPNPAMQGKIALDQANAQKAHAEAGHIEAKTAHLMADAQAIPMRTQTEADERSARIENLRAQAIGALAKVGLDHRDMNLQEAEAAVETLLRSIGQGHDQMMDHFQTPPPQAAQPSNSNGATT